MLVELGDKGFLSLPVSILVCAKDSPSSFNQCSPPGADLAWVDLEPASYLCCGLLTFECLKGYLSPNPPKDTDGRREESGRGVRELQGK